MSVFTDLRYSAKSLTRTPIWALALLLTIALGIGSNASVHGFVRGLITPDLPLPGIATIVSVFALDAQRAAGPVSYDSYLSLRDQLDVFQLIGAARESQDRVTFGERSSLMSVAAVTTDLAALLHLGLDAGVVISHRVWLLQFGAKTDVRGLPIRVAGTDTRVAGVAPEWLEGLYRGRAVDVWTLLSERSHQPIDRSSRSFWVLGRLRPDVSIDQAQIAVNAISKDPPPNVLLRYTGMTPEMAGGILRIGTLLRAAAAAVFLIACANVASFLLARASARSHETSVRVAIGARRGQLARQLLSDSVLISVSGAAVGVLLAVWTTNIIPALFFDQDAEHLVFAPDRFGILVASAACAGMTIACGLVPLFEVRHDNPAAVLQRESAGPSAVVRRVRAGLVLVQMAFCCLLVISTGLLLQGFRNALQTNIGNRVGQPILATVQAAPSHTRGETTALGFKYFDDAEQAALSVMNISRTIWVATLPGSRPVWHSVRVEPPRLPVRDVVLDVAAFTPQSVAQVVLPPLKGRMFGAADSVKCPVVVVNEEAAQELFDGDAVGRSIEDPAGVSVEIIGVVVERQERKDGVRHRPTIYYYAEQMDTPLGRTGPATFRVPILPASATGVLDANVVSPNYFESMGFSPTAGTIFQHGPSSGCRVGVINEEAADLYFGGNAVGGTIVDSADRRTKIIGVVRAARLRTAQRSIAPTIYFPLAQDFQPRMTMILDALDVNNATLASLRRRLELVPGGGPAPVLVTTLDAHLRRTALAPERIATILVGATAATGLTVGILGLYAVITDATRRRRREFALRLALGATRWRVVRHVFAEGVRMVSAGTIAGLLGSLLVARWLATMTPSAGWPSLWIWIAAPLVLVAAVAVASVLPARRAMTVDPLTIMRDV